MVVVHAALYSRSSIHDIHICLVQVHHWVVTHQQLVDVVHVRHNRKDHVVERQAGVVRHSLLRYGTQVPRHVSQVLVIIQDGCARNVVVAVDGAENVSIVAHHQGRAAWEDNLLLRL